jgi:hypothetical protein
MIKAKKTGIAKLRTSYTIKIFDTQGNVYIFKTDGKKFSNVKDDIFYEFGESIDGLFL